MTSARSSSYDLEALCRLVQHIAQADSWLEQSFAEQPQEQQPISSLEERLRWFAKNTLIVECHRSGE